MIRPHARSRHTLRTTLLVIALLLGFALLLSLALGAFFATRAPQWWSPVASDDPAAASTASSLENTATSTLHATPIGERWTFAITERQANAWLATRLPRWAANRGIPNYPADAALCVSFESGVIRAGASGLLGRSQAVITIVARPMVNADGAIEFQDVRLGIGALAAPPSLARSLLEEHTEHLGRFESAARDALRSGSMEIPAMHELDDARVIRIHDITVDEDAVTLDCVVSRR